MVYVRLVDKSWIGLLFDVEITFSDRSPNLRLVTVTNPSTTTTGMLLEF
jgi:hypothetical protein